ncbi:hypothetical protein JIY74_30175 [Vibrio harveyi]|nr:hypothetical protein [Vibrio harveyi]
MDSMFKHTHRFNQPIGS